MNGLEGLAFYLCILVYNLLLVMGIWTLFRPGMLLGNQGDWITKKLGEFWSKPLINCPPCMASVYGTIFFFAFGLYKLVPWWLFPLHDLALCGLATLAIMLDHE